MKTYQVNVNGTAYEVTLELVSDDGIAAAPAAAVPAAAPASAPAAIPAGGQAVKAPMPGNILAVNVKPGQKVKKGDILFILEALKMENEIMSPCDGTVKAVGVEKGTAVQTGAVLCTLA